MHIGDAQLEMRTRFVGGEFFIFPLTTLLLRLAGEPTSLSSDNTLYQLGAQVALVLPLSMPLLLPVARYRLTLFFPALLVLVGAHYLPFVFLYGSGRMGRIKRIAPRAETRPRANEPRA
jgi:hypothetical protein